MRGLVWAPRPPSPALSTGVGHSLGLLCLPFQTRLYSGSSREAGRQPCCRDNCKTGPHPQTPPQRRGQALPLRSPSQKSLLQGLRAYIARIFYNNLSYKCWISGILFTSSFHIQLYVYTFIFESYICAYCSCMFSYSFVYIYTYICATLYCQP